MELPPLPDLFLLYEPTSTCPLTGEPICLAEAELTLLGPTAVTVNPTSPCASATAPGSTPTSWARWRRSPA